ncbi:MAG: hypothetical protein DHS80DRAFT_32474 [Piptocephalis tieghemiana]|nr:MAG: hypothetical protein DHS80DRAFT_32474 [Piptocephalis tieghemiana]
MSPSPFQFSQEEILKLAELHSQQAQINAQISELYGRLSGQTPTSALTTPGAPRKRGPKTNVSFVGGSGDEESEASNAAAGILTAATPVATPTTKKRRKTSRGTKDPNAPKRPPSTFLMYCSSQRSAIREAHPDWPYTEIATELGRLWKDVPEGEKKRLDREYRKRYLQWREDIATHKHNLEMARTQMEREARFPEEHSTPAGSSRLLPSTGSTPAVHTPSPSTGNPVTPLPSSAATPKPYTGKKRGRKSKAELAAMAAAATAAPPPPSSSSSSSSSETPRSSEASPMVTPTPATTTMTPRKESGKKHTTKKMDTGKKETPTAKEGAGESGGKKETTPKRGGKRKPVMATTMASSARKTENREDSPPTKVMDTWQPVRTDGKDEPDSLFAVPFSPVKPKKEDEGTNAHGSSKKRSKVGSNGASGASKKRGRKNKV